MKMAGGDSQELCVKCKKVIKDTETGLVCGLWCRKSFHNKCLGFDNSEARAVSCSKLSIKFHCEACEKRLGIELFGEKEPQQIKNVEECGNNSVSLLDLVQNLVKLTNAVLNHNSAINSKLDTVLRSNAKIEYLLQSPKRFEERSDESYDNSVAFVEGHSPKRITEIREQYDDTNTSAQNIKNNQGRWCASEIQESYNSLFSIGSDFPEQLADSLHPSQQQNNAEDCSPSDWEGPDGHDSSEEPLCIIKEECSSSEDSPSEVVSALIVEEREDGEDEERAVIEAGMKRHSSSEGFLGPSTFSTENAEDDEAKEAVEDNNFEFQEVKQEVELTAAGSEPESSIPVVVEGGKSDEDGGGVVKKKRRRMRHVEHKCDVCKTKFAQLQELQEHTCVEKHNGLHSCGVCHKTFTSSSNLREHFRCHTGERPYICNICGKAFIYSSNLKQHLEVHMGDRPFKCVVCNKEFGLSLSLKQHMLLHTGECPYKCSFCSKEFCRKSNLKQHLRVHTGERPYKCSICNRAFTLLSSLQKHSRSHTGVHSHWQGIRRKKYTEGALMFTQNLTPMQL